MMGKCGLEAPFLNLTFFFVAKYRIDFCVCSVASRKYVYHFFGCKILFKPVIYNDEILRVLISFGILDQNFLRLNFLN